MSGRSYEHRRGWIETCLQALSEVCVLDVCAYAVMHNHYHVVLHADRKQALQWTELEVVTRWHQLFAGNLQSQRFLQEHRYTARSRKSCGGTSAFGVIGAWISVGTCGVNEAIARQANREDDCSGRFSEGRFKRQALLDEKALAACLTYVDLNPVRSRVAAAPATSAYTAVK